MCLGACSLHSAPTDCWKDVMMSLLTSTSSSTREVYLYHGIRTPSSKFGILEFSPRAGSFDCLRDPVFLDFQHWSYLRTSRFSSSGSGIIKPCASALEPAAPTA